MSWPAASCCVAMAVDKPLPVSARLADMTVFIEWPWRLTMPLQLT